MTDEVENQEIETAIPQEGEVQESTENVEEKAEEIAAKEEEIEKSKEETRSKRKERNNRRATAHIQKLEKQLQEMREEMAYMKGRQETQQIANQEPNPDDYETPREYRDALQNWADQQEPETETHSDQEIQPVSQGPQIEPEVFEAYQTAGEERFGDEFLDMMEAAGNNEFDCSPIMADTLFRSDVGPELAMHLYDHPREATKIAKMSPSAQVREMLKLEAKLSAAPAKQVSKAPKPVNPEKGGNPTVTDLSKPMDTASYIAARRAQMQAK